MDESRQARAERIARDVLTQLGLKKIARVEAVKPSLWRLTIYGDRLIELEFETQASDENMRRDLRRQVRDALSGN